MNIAITNFSLDLRNQFLRLWSRRVKPVLWIRNIFFVFSDPDPTLTLIPDSDPDCLWKIHLNYRSSKTLLKKLFFLSLYIFTALYLLFGNRTNLDPDLNPDPNLESDPELTMDPDPNLQIISDPGRIQMHKTV
jgi:hypothetical protein